MCAGCHFTCCCCVFVCLACCHLHGESVSAGELGEVPKNMCLFDSQEVHGES